MEWGGVRYRGYRGMVGWKVAGRVSLMGAMVQSQGPRSIRPFRREMR